MVLGGGPIGSTPLGARPRRYGKRISPALEEELLLGAIVSDEREVADGSVVNLLAPAWETIAALAAADPTELFQLSPRQWEEVVAATYDRAGYDEVILTPRSGDFGRDVIAVKHGWGSVRILDQVKAFKPGHRVDANDVRAILGVLNSDRNATKAVVTTTSVFAPRIEDDPTIAPYRPHRLELVDGEELFARIKSLEKK